MSGARENADRLRPSFNCEGLSEDCPGAVVVLAAGLVHELHAVIALPLVTNGANARSAITAPRDAASGTPIPVDRRNSCCLAR